MHAAISIERNQTGPEVQIAADAVTQIPGPVESALTTVRSAQEGWSRLPVSDRIKMLGRFRRHVGGQTRLLCSQLRECRPETELLFGEIVPWLEAIKFLEANGENLLAPKIAGGKGLPWWLAGVRSETQRVPHGVVLILAPCNYPWLLPGVQVVQALAAGNTVLWKPALGGTQVAELFLKLALESGLPQGVLKILPEDRESGELAISLGVDKVVLTGNSSTGQKVLRQLANQLTPASLELSGCDAMWIREDADLDLAARAVNFSLTWNNSATCMASRRIFVHRTVAAEFTARLRQLLCQMPLQELDSKQACRILPWIIEARNHGAGLVHGELTANGAMRGPIVLSGVRSSFRIAQEDLFAPVLSILEAGDDEAVLGAQSECPYALTASVFSRDEQRARELAERWRAGVILINDVIAPTADPRIPFGGRGASGFGVTRGAEGLLEMTVPRVIQVNRSRWRPHYQPATRDDLDFFHDTAGMVHGSSLANRFQSLLKAISSSRRATRPWHTPSSLPNKNTALKQNP